MDNFSPNLAEDPEELTDQDDFLTDEAVVEEKPELFEQYSFTADSGQSLLRIDKFLVCHIAQVSRNRIQDAAEAGMIQVNGQPVKSNYRVKPGDEIKVLVAYPPRDTSIIPEDIPLNIVYEDQDLLVVNKEAGMVVHPGHGNFSGTLVNALAWHFKDHSAFSPNDPRPGLVHRIDKDTSGLLVVAKNPDAKTNLSRQFFEKTSLRTYQALVWGRVEQDEGRIDCPLGRSRRDRLQMTVCEADDPACKPAVTNYRVLERLGYVTLVECRLETGRTHQIRVHMKHLGHPLFNDERYGGDQILKGTRYSKYKQFVENCFTLCPRQALHAKTLGFKHPTKGLSLFFDSELPDDMLKLIDKWRKYTASREEL
ncbi:MAG: RluA family pseudouridine synthase [Bacteroidales bacterium]|nr:RluA family pseudouridine synthase [Bacteroidales bacterium]MDD4361663.1 RluA family pseudouridine synthase [Bacteroidales bacterium]MDD4430071.1 RluA family pseudouridine synthase [Bacteroidales bacterium]